MANERIIWEGVYHHFSDVPVEGPGFDGETWIANSLKKMEALREDLERNVPLPPPGNYREGLLPLLAALTYREQKKLRILDFGGGIGFTYYQTVFGLPLTEGIEYHIVERESVCEAGRKFFGTASHKPIFHSTLPCPPEKFDIVHMGSSLQYIGDWKQVLSELCTLSRKYLLLIDVLAGNIPTFASVSHYYGSRIPVWLLNIEELLQTVHSLRYELMYQSAYPSVIWGVEQELPMQNFESQYRLKRPCNLLFVARSEKESAET